MGMGLALIGGMTVALFAQNSGSFRPATVPTDPDTSTGYPAYPTPYNPSLPVGPSNLPPGYRFPPNYRPPNYPQNGWAGAPNNDPAATPPTNAPAAAAAAPAPTPTPALSPEILGYSRDIAIIEGKRGQGTGFLAKFKEGSALVTNAHVLSGNAQPTFRLGNGSTITMEGFRCAQDYDLTAIDSAAITDGIPVVDDLNAIVHIGDDVVVLGNSLGAGVATQIFGKVTGIGPELVEIDAKFVAGNSGSPVIHVASGKVIGIATYSMIHKSNGAFGKDSALDGVERRFAYRLDNVAKWNTVSWPLFVREGDFIDDFSHHSDCLTDLQTDIEKHGEVSFQKYLAQDNTLRDAVQSFKEEVDKHQMSTAYYLEAKKRFLWFVTDACAKDVNAVQPRQLTPYHRKRLEELLADRQDLEKYFHDLYNEQDALSDANAHKR